MRVFVKNMRGQALMPCSQRKARLLLKQKKAKIVGYKPFTIQLCYATGEAKQEVTIGIDEGARHIGVAIVSQDKVLVKGEIELRQDVHSLLLTRAQYRRSRRYRKTRYRKARFLNRKKPEWWLPPSIQTKLDANFAWIDKFCSLVPSPKLRIEVGKFDTAKMINPDIHGVDYQHGQTYGYYDVRYYVFSRDGYTCQVCQKKGKTLHTHHIIYQSEGGTDRADNLITVCSDCHTSENHKKGGILWKWMKNHKKAKQYKEPPFINTLRRRTFQKYPEAEITYGSETSPKRKELCLEKTHYNDAIAITGIESIKENPEECFWIKQFRKKKRSLHEATPRKGRKVKNVKAKRNSKNTKQLKGWYLNDEVICFGQRGWISGFTGTSSAYVTNRNGEYIQNPNKSYKQVNLSSLKPISHNSNWQYAVE
jgi:hypothetical protein